MNVQTMETLLYEEKEHVALVTISRPEKLNALNATAKRELQDLFQKLRTEESVHVVVVTGAGEKAFVAGTDIQELTALEERSGVEFATGGQGVFDLIENLGKPVIAAVNGYALGGGCELAMACHIRVASDKAKFGQPEVNLGIIPGYGGTQRLARIVGRAKALELILTGVQVDAAEALRIGLVNQVVPASDLLPRSMAMARAISSFGQHAVRQGLRAVVEGLECSLADGQRLEAKLFGTCCATEDFKEGTAAFLQRRKPLFRNK